MNIIVLNGSPKGDNSVTMAYVKYLKTVYPQHVFTTVHIAQTIHKLEKDSAAFNSLIEEIRKSDAVLWAFPLYYLLVHSNYKRFIELIFDRKVQDAFAEKYTAVLTTSIHFYDHTAHNYMQGICEDLDMNFVSSFSAAMNDLMEEQERKNLIDFADDFFDATTRKIKTIKAFPRIKEIEQIYEPKIPTEKINIDDLKIYVLTETEGMSKNLEKMIWRFKESFSDEIEVIDLSKINIAGGCLGCVKCGMDNLCAYDGKDDVRVIYEEKLKKADAVVFAGTMKDRYFSARWKTFVDRSFFNTHQPRLTGIQVGYFVSGALADNQNLRQVIQASSEIDKANLIDIITDESQSSSDLDSIISYFAERLIQGAKNKTKKPRTFLGVGASKIFRDEMWGDLRFIFQEDYRYYKKHGMLDFPQKNFKTRLTHLMIPIIRIPAIKKKVREMSKDMMHAGHDRVVANEEKVRKINNENI
jgi:multimeric flavodoxin WrbA